MGAQRVGVSPGLGLDVEMAEEGACFCSLRRASSLRAPSKEMFGQKRGFDLVNTQLKAFEMGKNP